MAETKLRQYAVVERLNKMDVDLIIVSPSCDSDAIPNDDIIFNFTEIPNAVSVNSGSAIIQSIHVLDKAAQAQTMDIFFQTDSTSLGTLGGDPSMGDSDATDIIGFTTLSSWSAGGTGWHISTKTNIGMVVQAPAGSRSIYFAGINRSGSNATYGASGLQFKIGIVKD